MGKINNNTGIGLELVFFNQDPKFSYPNWYLDRKTKWSWFWLIHHLVANVQDSEVGSSSLFTYCCPLVLILQKHGFWILLSSWPLNMRWCSFRPAFECTIYNFNDNTRKSQVFAGNQLFISCQSEHLVLKQLVNQMINLEKLDCLMW